MSRTTYGEHRHQTMAQVVVYRWIKTTEYFYGVIQKVDAIAYKRLATVVISQEKVKYLDLGGRYGRWSLTRGGLTSTVFTLEWTTVLDKTRATSSLTFFLVLILEEIHKRTYQ